MKLRLPALLTVATAATASVALIAGPAVAAPFVNPTDGIVINGTTWAFSAVDSLDGFGFLEFTADGGGSNGFDFTQFAIQTRTSGGELALNCDNADLSVAANLDRVITCDPQDIAELTITPSVRIAAEGDLARFYVSITNPTENAVDYAYTYYADLGDGSQRITSSGDTSFEVNDVWMVNDQSGAGEQSGGFAWGLPDAAQPVAVGYNGNFYSAQGQPDAGQQALAIAPGATINLAFYHLLPNTLVADPTGMENLITSMSEFSTFDSRLTAGLPGGTVVANWATVPASLEEPTADAVLAATGVNATAPALGALALVLMGLLALGVVRRRTAGRS